MVFENFMLFMNKIMLFSSYVNNASGFPKPLTPEEEKMYFEKFKNGDNIIIVNGQPCEVLGLYTIRAVTVMRPKNVTSLFIDYEHNSSLAIHVGRNDTKQYFGTLLADGSTVEFMLFTNADVMQAIPVYLSATTPPPLMRKSCNAISFEVAA